MELAFYPRYLIRSLSAHGRSRFFKAGYRLIYPECGRHGMNPWQHYVLEGRRKGFGDGNNPPDTLFFPEGYELEYPDVKAAGLDAWHHFAEKGHAEGRDNGLHPDGKLFFADGYLAMYPDAAESGMDPWHHYVLLGKKEGRDCGLHPDEKLFFAEGYHEMYPDTASSGLDPWHHYVLLGKKEGRDSGHHPDGSVFFPEGYRRNYPGCVDEPCGSDPWMNYIKVGKKKNRNNGLSPSGPFFAVGYLEIHPGSSVIDAWKDYVLNSPEISDWDAGLYPEGSGWREILRKRNPSVAIILPALGSRERVMEAVRSVLHQTWGSWHLYVVGDFPGDGTSEYLEPALADPRIILLRNEGRGNAGARNTAAAHLRDDDYAAYLDPESYWSREYLELMLCRLLETRACCCYSARRIFLKTKDGETLTQRFVYEPFDIRRLHESDCIDLSVLMHRTSVFADAGAFDEASGSLSGWDFVQRLAERYSFSRLPYVGCGTGTAQNEAAAAEHQSARQRRYLNLVRSRHLTDWDFLASASDRTDESLVSVIVCYGRNDSPAFLRNCLASLKNARLYGHSEYRTEIILVDDSCSGAGRAASSAMYRESLADKYLANKSECGFALSCNRALSLAEGSFTVYLDSETYVSTGWLHPLIAPLKRHKALMGTAALVLQPDGSVGSAGCLLDSVSGMPYDFLHGLPSAVPSAGRLTLLPCVGSCCAAFRTRDVISAKGLSCLYESGLAVSDLALRLGGARARFACIPSSRVICPGDTERQSSRINDLAVFEESWSGKTGFDCKRHFAGRIPGRYLKPGERLSPASFNKHSAAPGARPSAGFFAPLWDYTKLCHGCGLSPEQQNLIRRTQSLTKLIVIKDPAPGIPSYKKYEWGDYYYARSLAKAFSGLGFEARIDSREDWYGHNDSLCVNLVLRGCVRFECGRSPDSVNAMWLISHPDMTLPGELNEYDCVLAASQILAEKLRSGGAVRVPCAYLPQCSDPDIFSPGPALAAYSSGNLLLGNSRGVLRDTVKKCVDEGVGVEIIGNDWSWLVKPELIRSAAVPSFLVPFFYRGAEAVLNDHWADMRQNGIVSNRIFDVLSCGRGIVTDNFENIPDELKFACFSYEHGSIREAIEKCREFNQSLTHEEQQKLHAIIADRHSFYRRALQILEALYPVLAAKAGK